MRSGKAVFGIIGTVLALIAIGLLVAGGWLIWAYGTQRNDEGYLVTPTAQVSTDTYALTSTALDLGAIRNDWLPADWLATIQVGAEPRGSEPLFVGIGPADAVSEYLSGVAHAEVTRIDSADEVTYLVEDGGPASEAPSAQPFWEVSTEGDGPQTITWDIEEGQWTMVIMNSDASSAIAAEIYAGAKSPWLLVALIGLSAVGLVFAALAVLTIGLALRGRPGDAPPVMSQPAHVEPARSEPAVSGVDHDAAR